MVNNSITFTLHSAPLSLNNAKYRSGRKKRSTHLWLENIYSQLPSHRLTELSLSFDPTQEYLSFSISHYVNLYTKSGKISQKSNDLGNIEKYLIDAICSSKVNEFCPNLNTDDAYILDLVSKKRHTAKPPHIIVEIERLSLSELEQG